MNQVTDLANSRIAESAPIIAGVLLFVIGILVVIGWFMNKIADKFAESTERLQAAHRDERAQRELALKNIGEGCHKHADEREEKIRSALSETRNCIRENTQAFRDAIQTMAEIRGSLNNRGNG